MREIKCPHCSKSFNLDDAGYADILKQVRDGEFEAELHERLESLEKEKSSALDLAEAEANLRVHELQAKLDATEVEHQLALTQALAKVERERDELKAKVDQAELANKIAITEATSRFKEERDNLQKSLEVLRLEKDLSEQSLKKTYDMQIRERDEVVKSLREMRAKLSTKMVGETLEQHCLIEFDRTQAILSGT
jgi:hypothetical protein